MADEEIPLTRAQADQQSLKDSIRESIAEVDEHHAAAEQAVNDIDFDDAKADEETAVEGTDESTEDPEDGAVDESTPESEPSEVELLHIDDFGDDMVEFKANGETHQLPLRDVVALAQKGFNYESKSTALGESRKALEEDARLGKAVRENPAEFVRRWSAANGASSTEPTYGDFDEYQDPSDDDPKIAALEKRLAAYERKAAAQQFWSEVDSKISKLEEAEGPIDREALRKVMVEKNIANPADAYAILNFETVKSGASRIAAQEQKASRRKAKSVSRVHRRGSAPAESVTTDPLGSLDRKEAVQAAIAEYNAQRS